MDKTAIRRHIREQKRLLTDADKVAAEQSVIQQLESLPAFANAQKILLYNSLPDELPTTEMLRRWHATKDLYLPRVSGEELEILRYAPDAVITGAYGIYEPVGEAITDESIIELIIVPAIAFDRHGNRIGRGKGYYDRLLCRTSALKIGICYAFQLIPDFSPDAHDIPVDMVITP